jgi:uncharacterized protein (DUF885 family)
LLDRLDAIPACLLSQGEDVTRRVLEFELRSSLARLECRLEELDVQARSGPQVDVPQVLAVQVVDTPESGERLVSRVRAFQALVDGHVASLRAGMAQQRRPVAASVARVVAQIEAMLAVPEADSAFLEPLRRPRPEWSATDEGAFRTRLTDAHQEVVRPALAGYCEFLKKDVLPLARGDDRPGIVHLADGLGSYAALAWVFTSIAATPAELHAIGLESVAAVRDEMSVLSNRLFPGCTWPEIQRRLRSDAAMFFTTRMQIVERAEACLARASAAAPAWFATLPRVGCVVKPVEPYEEKDTTIAYYRQPAPDGSRPGAYFVNTYAPETRPRYEAEVLAFHESVPGHHLQLARAQELPLPEFRRHHYATAFVEGWGLYCERLADEMGLYSGDLDRMGMLSFDAWRACRLVVDTGLHARGWTRDEAIAYMLANTALAENKVLNEVDRYITWPGQALAYKMGQREIFRLRSLAHEKMGARFDLRRFHERLLENGGVPLAVAAEQIEAWAEEDT